MAQMPDMPAHYIYCLYDGDAKPKEQFAGWFAHKDFQGIRFYGLTAQAVRDGMRKQWDLWQAEREKGRANCEKQSERAKARTRKAQGQSGDGQTKA